jgi:hypothetical protein
VPSGQHAQSRASACCAEGRIASAFIKSHPLQLTQAVRAPRTCAGRDIGLLKGLEALKQRVRRGAVVSLFKNNHFYTLTKGRVPPLRRAPPLSPPLQADQTTDCTRY